MKPGMLAGLAVVVCGSLALVAWLMMADAPAPAVSSAPVVATPDESVGEAAPAPEPARRPATAPPKQPAIRPRPSSPPPRPAPAPKAPKAPPAVPGHGLPEATAQGLEADGNIEPADAEAVARFLVPRIRECMADGGPNFMVLARVHVINNGGSAAVLQATKVLEAPGDIAAMQVCVERALNSQKVPVGELGVDALVSVPVYSDR